MTQNGKKGKQVGESTKLFRQLQIKFLKEERVRRILLNKVGMSMGGINHKSSPLSL
jgi:hypothetical protein